MIIGTFEHLNDDEIIIADPVSDDSGLNKILFNVGTGERLDVVLPPGKYLIDKKQEGLAYIYRDDKVWEPVSMSYRGAVDTSFTEWLCISDVAKYCSNEFFYSTPPECVSFDAVAFRELAKHHGIFLNAEYKEYLQGLFLMREFPYVSELHNDKLIKYAGKVANNSWYMHFCDMAFKAKSSGDGVISYPGFSAVATLGEVYDIFCAYSTDGICGLMIRGRD